MTSIMVNCFLFLLKFCLIVQLVCLTNFYISSFLFVAQDINRYKILVKYPNNHLIPPEKVSSLAYDEAIAMVCTPIVVFFTDSFIVNSLRDAGKRASQLM